MKNLANVSKISSVSAIAKQRHALAFFSSHGCSKKRETCFGSILNAIVQFPFIDDPIQNLFVSSPKVLPYASLMILGVLDILGSDSAIPKRTMPER